MALFCAHRLLRRRQDTYKMKRVPISNALFFLISQFFSKIESLQKVSCQCLSPRVATLKTELF